MRPWKIGALVVALLVVAVVLYQALVFAKEAGALILATLRVSQQTAEHNERIAASLADARLGERITALASGLESALNETTQTLQAVRPVIADTAATARTARVAIEETALTAKAARVAIESAKLPDVDGLLRQTGALVEQTTTLVRNADASATPLLATSQKLLDRVDRLVVDSELTATLRTTGRILSNVEHDQGNVSTLVANAVPVSESVKRETAIIEQELAELRAKKQKSHGLFGFLARLFF